MNTAGPPGGMGGGIYAVVSRSVGPELGAALGVLLALACASRLALDGLLLAEVAGAAAAGGGGAGDGDRWPALAALVAAVLAGAACLRGGHRARVAALAVAAAGALAVFGGALGAATDAGHAYLGLGGGGMRGWFPDAACVRAAAGLHSRIVGRFGNCIREWGA